MAAADPPPSPSTALTQYVADVSPKAKATKPQQGKSSAQPPPDAATFTAQIMGQTGARRGLKGGPPVLKQARSAYLETEYSGEHDRRPPAGLLRKTKV
jgi:hypothetical protein